MGWRIMARVKRVIRLVGGSLMPSLALWRSAALTLALVVCVTPAMAASGTIGRFLPRLELTAMFDLDRSSPAGPGGSRTADEASSEGSPVADDEGEAAGKDAAAASAPDARRKPGAGGQQRAPRWKSLIPGALK